MIQYIYFTPKPKVNFLTHFFFCKKVKTWRKCSSKEWSKYYYVKKAYERDHYNCDIMKTDFHSASVLALNLHFLLSSWLCFSFFAIYMFIHVLIFYLCVYLDTLSTEFLISLCSVIHKSSLKGKRLSDSNTKV